jgi:hypothetical protein
MAARKVPDPLIGRVLLHWRIEERIGHGEMAVVYRGRHIELDKTVAIKVMKVEWGTTRSCGRALPKRPRRLRCSNPRTSCASSTQGGSRTSSCPTSSWNT